jgi:hypothetical protein
MDIDEQQEWPAEVEKYLKSGGEVPQGVLNFIEAVQRIFPPVGAFSFDGKLDREQVELWRELFGREPTFWLMIQEWLGQKRFIEFLSVFNGMAIRVPTAQKMDDCFTRFRIRKKIRPFSKLRPTSRGGQPDPNNVYIGMCNGAAAAHSISRETVSRIISGRPASFERRLPK